MKFSKYFYTILLNLIIIHCYSQENFDKSAAINYTGSQFPSIKLLDTLNNRINLDLQNDTIYLIDYWASWCLPCIKYKVPLIKKLYQDYKHKPFQIISISLDNIYDEWVKSIAQHAIPGMHYSALKGFNTDDVTYFHINGIPYTILVGMDKKIIQMDPAEAEITHYLDNL